MQEMLAQLVRGESLSEAQAHEAFESILSGAADEAQIAALLALIQQRGATVDEIVGAARAMREHVTRVPHDLPRVIDTCGTGGAPKTFNVSTAAALIAAAAGAHVAKHGNRSRTGRGSAEILQALGVNVDAAPQLQGACLTQARICFSFAIHHHPAMKHAIGPRRSLGFPTLFNLLGPLTNPAGAKRQLIGVYRPELMRPIAEALRRLGAERAMVVHADDGLDELSTTAPTQAALLRDGEIQVMTLHARELGIRPPADGLAALQARDIEDAQRRIEGVFDGDAGFMHERDMACLNAAAALFIADLAPDLREAFRMARAAVEEGRARETLARLVKVSRSA